MYVVCVAAYMYILQLFCYSNACTAELWEWEDEHSKWHGYNAGTCRLLEASHLCSVNTVNTSSMGRSYTVDLKRMVQVNDTTKMERNIRRVDTSSLAGN